MEGTSQISRLLLSTTIRSCCWNQKMLGQGMKEEDTEDTWITIRTV